MIFTSNKVELFNKFSSLTKNVQKLERKQTQIGTLNVKKTKSEVFQKQIKNGIKI